MALNPSPLLDSLRIERVSAAIGILRPAHTPVAPTRVSDLAKIPNLQLNLMPAIERDIIRPLVDTLPQHSREGGLIAKDRELL